METMIRYDYVAPKTTMMCWIIFKFSLFVVVGSSSEEPWHEGPRPTFTFILTFSVEYCCLAATFN
ncbi:hypothetical protein EV361DRAFT_902329 [Lentinula raphanica]|nr:hypothetical protein C8R42DRAFT_680747 [Lentinula raphanica]KAJ3973030.1 hypothetical protein EV361DRAFT_902329 [Lentinula raphanica]